MNVAAPSVRRRRFASNRRARRPGYRAEKQISARIRMTTSMQFRGSSLIAVAIALVACQQKSAAPVPLPTSEVTRGDIAARVQATGTVEPINPVEIKSKASGQIIQMPVEVGAVVKRGQLLAQIDPRDVKNKFDQALAGGRVS